MGECRGASSQLAHEHHHDSSRSASLLARAPSCAPPGRVRATCAASASRCRAIADAAIASKTTKCSGHRAPRRELQLIDRARRIEQACRTVHQCRRIDAAAAPFLRQHCRAARRLTWKNSPPSSRFVETPDSGIAVLDKAVALARHFDARVELLVIEPLPHRAAWRRSARRSAIADVTCAPCHAWTAGCTMILAAVQERRPTW